MVKVAPSILSADFGNLGNELEKVEKFSDAVHFDVMDGHFVPNITVGPIVLEGIRKHTRLPIEAHLMIEKPDDFVDCFAKAGADIITVHVESGRQIGKTLARIRALGKKAGISLNPETPVSRIKPLLDKVDLVLVMTVNPGFGGQKFIESSLAKIRKVKSLLKEMDSSAEIEVDGGINGETARKAVEAGADILVAGSYIYRSGDPARAVKILKKTEYK